MIIAGGIMNNVELIIEYQYCEDLAEKMGFTIASYVSNFYVQRPDNTTLYKTNNVLELKGFLTGYKKAYQIYIDTTK